MDFWVPNLAKNSKNPHRWFDQGLQLYDSGQVEEAVRCFRQAYILAPEKPAFMSYFGLCRVVAESGAGREALGLCEEAVRKDPYDAELRHNLGMAYLVSGRKRRAYEIFTEGSRLDPRNVTNRQELEFMGVRRPPVFTFLPRGHRVNRLAGRTLKRLRLR